MMNKLAIRCLIMPLLTAFTSGVGLHARSPDGSGIPGSREMLNLKAEWTVMNQSLPKQRARDRFNENKFGMFITWGLYSIPGGIWKGQKMEDGGEGPTVAEWIMRRKEIPRAEYARLADQFNPADFDADEWVAIAKAAGMRYLLITAKFCDGFALYDSEISPFNSVDGSPFARDVVRELETACAKAGLDFAIYFAHSLDWMNGGDGGFLKYGPDPPIFKVFPNLYDPAPVSFDQFIEQSSLPQFRELVTKYNISSIFLDTPLFIPAEYSFQFYKTAFGANPETLITQRIGNGFGDIRTPGDNKLPDDVSGDCTEVIATTNNSWGYKSYDQDWKSPVELLYLLVSSVSKGANFMLNVGPTGEGAMPAGAVESLMQVGAWLKVNGEAVYGTSAWKVQREGPTQVEFESTEQRLEDGFNSSFTSQDFWFSQKDGVIYAISLARPKQGEAVSISSFKGLPIKSIRLLGDSSDFEWHETVNAIQISLPEFNEEGIGYALAIYCDD